MHYGKCDDITLVKDVCYTYGDTILILLYRNISVEINAATRNANISKYF